MMAALPTPLRRSPGRPKDPAKRDAVLAAARQLFSQQSYEGVSVEQIATAAGVSKLTIYSHFGDKEALFVEVVSTFCAQALPEPLFNPAPETPLRQRLTEIALAFHSMVHCDEAIAGHRMLCGTLGGVPPELLDRFWEAGPERFVNALGELLQRRVEAGELVIHEPVEVAASHFYSLIKGDAHAMRMMGVGEAPDEAATRAHVDSVVNLFLRAYASDRG